MFINQLEGNFRSNTVPVIKNAPVNKNGPLFSSIYRYVPKGLEVFSLQILSSFMFGLQDLEKNLEYVNFKACFIKKKKLIF
jgi:hypothetical protein